MYPPCAALEGEIAMQVAVDVNRRNTIRLLESLLGVAACALGITTVMNILPWQGHLIYGSEPTFSLNVLQTSGFAAYSVIGISLLLLVIAATTILHAIRRSSMSRVVLLVAVVGLAAFVALTFGTIGTLFLLSAALAVGAAALSFAWR
jgi:hypothetical protein